MGGSCVPDSYCNAAGACAEGMMCVAAVCQPILPEEQRFSVAEGAGIEIAPPAGVRIAAPGESRLGALSLTSEGALSFTSTTCAASSELIESSIKLADGSPGTLQSLIEVYDPGAPQAPTIELRDLPADELVELSFSVPPENPEGSCAAHSFSLSWTLDGQPQTEEIHSEAPVGAVISRRLSAPWGQQLTARLRAADETGAASEGQAQLALTRPVVREFSLVQDHGAPSDNVELRYAVERATRVQLLRNGVVIEDSNSALSGSWSVPVGGQPAVLSLIAYDELENPHSYPSSLHVSVDAAQQVGSEGTAAGEISAGVVSEGDRDIWILNMPYDGGHFEVSGLEIGGRCTAALRMGLQGYQAVEGSCPSIGLQQNANLSRGSYYLTVESVGPEPVEYALRVTAERARCGNGVVETNAVEPCDGGPYCDESCRPSIMLRDEGLHVLSSHAIEGVRKLRIGIQMDQLGWVDIGTGNYVDNSCAGASRITLEDPYFQPIEVYTEGGPGDCARLIRRMEPGKYYASIEVGASVESYRLNAFGFAWGTEGDGVVNPLAGEMIDSSGSNQGKAWFSYLYNFSAPVADEFGNWGWAGFPSHPLTVRCEGCLEDGVPEVYIYVTNGSAHYLYMGAVSEAPVTIQTTGGGTTSIGYSLPPGVDAAGEFPVLRVQVNDPTSPGD